MWLGTFVGFNLPMVGTTTHLQLTTCLFAKGGPALPVLAVEEDLGCFCQRCDSSGF